MNLFDTTENLSAQVEIYQANFISFGVISRKVEELYFKTNEVSAYL